ncbi:MAG TPA: HAD-IIA family hydrolase [Candidatus Korarchaeota archaeon]|mgnify:CR=1 FL=1|nr:HAD-IIA family hydrolase [Candidatus Korarchaeota archaeon]
MPKIVERYEGYLIDLDGVLWAGQKVFPDAIRAVNSLHSLGKSIVFLTNNSTKSRAQYVEKLRKIGVGWVREQDIVNSGFATAKLLKEQRGPLKAFPFGDVGLYVELMLQGHRLVTEDWCWAGDVDAVVVGMDPNVTYWKIGAAANAIRAGADFVATNPDKTFPTERGLMPGAGTMIAALEAASGRGPDLIVGKPYKPIFDMALSVLGIEKSKVLVVGDRLDTDVIGAKNARLDCALVLTGVARAEDVEASSAKPNYILGSLEELLLR